MPGPVVLALVDADRAVDVVLAARLDQPVDVRAADVDRVVPQPLPQLVPAAERRRRLRPGVRGVQRHERLGQDRELRAGPAASARRPTALSTVASASRITGVAWIAATRTVSNCRHPASPPSPPSGRLR